ncbi:L-threonylcarbamoyladenylate synthase [Acetobacter orleanensis]|uniref:Threonylcarbamoyl-AMP synthase n=1 Tax=Acetobacter orleanensis TaxID=104099 RepID=A0A4Y3TK01_9PROT|nr:L-threonylcarbamoyladenylate synthase [Acetobacter orleanensis]KXV62894.1 translation factor Sua5 [Acetobacter orleanensis]PCD80672.1 L-threonylcarbamoyladenylate synthase [Acetobacter orleanensis]GAN67980.1 translation modulator Sua5/YciO/YrdC/YwlC [Acetobacter orleanensis JCM 7639]GBR27450.1 translation modulator Sua5/YciO/YrdC/YwlC [Acetobacter orleanensis NRIC 0473]GEB82098.1 threonylcarbamoyl-AMP synthase [Acetobacter orleanensis]
MTERLAATPSGIATAAHILREGGLVAFGTETVYGLGGDATQPAAVARIFEAKNRPRFNPLISHFASAEAAFTQVQANPLALKLAEAFWPGPLTLVLPRTPDSTVSDLAADGLSSLAVRVPRGDAVLALLEAVGRPVAAPSANRSGRISPSDASHVLEELEGRIDAVLDTGPCTVGLESTVLDLTDPSRPCLLRPGGIPVEALEVLCGPLAYPETNADTAPLSPGRMLSHYAPSLPVRLNATSISPQEGLLAFGPTPLPDAVVTWNLSPTGNLEEAAARLFSGLRFLDSQQATFELTGLAVQPIPTQGLGLAIQDRLRRAAAPRPTDADKP